MKSLVYTQILHPYWVTGFSDAESCFLIIIPRNKKSRIQVQLRFQFALHIKDLDILNLIKTYFNEVGNITFLDTIVLFRVKSWADLEIIINHFDNYPLITKKWIDYQLFKQAFLLVKNKIYLTPEEIQKILIIRASMNKGLSDNLKAEYPHIIQIEKPLKLEIKDPNWLSGFITGKGNFFINFSGAKVKLRFTIIQYPRDAELLKYLIDYFGCGNNTFSIKNAVYYTVEKFSDIKLKIIPFLKKYTILGTKAKVFFFFCEASKIVAFQSQKYSTYDEAKRIVEIKNNMNNNRVPLRDLKKKSQIIESNLFFALFSVYLFVGLFFIFLIKISKNLFSRLSNANKFARIKFSP